jgi:hypothetical protein
MDCKKIRFMLDSIAEISFENGFNEGAKHGMAVASDGIPSKIIKEKCPACDCQKSFHEKQFDKYQEESDRLQRDKMYYEYGRRQK